MSLLAIDGGNPVRVSSFPPWPYFEKDEIDAVVRVLQSGNVNYWTGKECKLFEEEFADVIGSDFAISVANGTVALEAALTSLGIGPGCEVVVPSRTFIASASCIAMCGAKPIVADVDPVSQNVTAESIERVLTPKTKAVVVVHLAGWPCDMDSIMNLARSRGIYVIEDCAQALGAQYKGKMVGSIGHVGAFSFCQDKILTTGGEGGMITTNDRELWNKMWSYKDHGKDYATVHRGDHPFGFRWLHERFGTNLRMSEMQAAIGRLQLKKLPEWLELRKRNANILTECFSSIPTLRTTMPSADVSHAYYKYYAFIRPDKNMSGWSVDKIAEAIAAEGVFCNTGSCSEIYREKAFTAAEKGPIERLPVARQLGETSLMFLVHPTLTSGDVEDTCKAVSKVFGAIMD